MLQLWMAILFLAQASNAPNPPAVADELARDDANLQDLLAQVRTILPRGWKAAITPDEPDEYTKLRYLKWIPPVLLVWREEKALGYYTMPGPPAGGPQDEPHSVFFNFTLMPYMTVEQHKQAAAANSQRNQRRLDAESKLTGIKKPPWKGSGPPWPPTAYYPETSEQKDRLRRYAILWMQTEPQQLPNYYFRTLSFHALRDSLLVLANPEEQAELDRVRKALFNLVSAYPTTPTP